MTYLRAKKKYAKKKIAITLAVILVLYGVSFAGVFQTLYFAVQRVAASAWTAQKDIANFDIGALFFADKREILAENARLKEEAEIASAKLLDRNLLFEENIELKEILGRDSVGRTVFAVVLVKPNRTPYDTLIIDVGENVGVKRGDAVLYGGTIAVGVVEEVFARSSKVSLLSSHGEELDVIVGDESVTATAYGRGGGEFSINLPRDTAVKVGDIVVVQNIAPRILGAVEHIETKPSDPFKTILFKGPINVFKMKWVEVVMDAERTDNVVPR